jgi:ElaA protein
MTQVDVKKFSELSTQELFMIYKLRVAVFVVEQKCYYQEVDDDDLISVHVMFKGEDGHLMAYARIIPEPNNHAVRIGRVVVNPADRGNGLGRKLVQTTMEKAQQRFPKAGKIVLAGQEYLKDFYHSFGFVDVSAVYLEDNIPHIDMELTL